MAVVKGGLCCSFNSGPLPIENAARFDVGVGIRSCEGIREVTRREMETETGDDGGSRCFEGG